MKTATKDRGVEERAEANNRMIQQRDIKFHSSLQRAVGLLGGSREGILKVGKSLGSAKGV